MKAKNTKPQDKLNTVLEQLNLRKSEEWKFMEACEMLLGKKSKQYKNSVMRWGQWHEACELVNNIINNK